MKIPFKIIDNRYIAKAEVEIPEQILNHFPSYIADEDGYLDIPHVRNTSFTRIMGDIALRFTEESNKLPIPDSEYKGIHISCPDSKKSLIEEFGFQYRGPALLWHPVFGKDIDKNWIKFDSKTDQISILILKVITLGWRQGRERTLSIL